MQAENLTEYNFVRKEMGALRSCITTYMGFVIGGAGVAYLGAAALNGTNEMNERIVLTFLILSLIITMVLVILFYKFNSHNRYSGYCKLLNQEQFNLNKTLPQFMSWEVCMDVLREVDDNPVLMNKAVSEIISKGIYPNYNSSLEKYTKHKNFISKMFIGLGLLIATLFRFARPRSWNFPLYVTAIFFSLVILFIASGFYYYFQLKTVDNPFLMTGMFWFVGIIQIYLWGSLLIRLYELMKGMRTIEAYCLRFLPVRYSYIKGMDDQMIYNLITLK